ncbi:MAG: Lrp/AsnC family transcriptional regulator [Candidatus Aenigmarchaeota archaeon]|nr:Lrp/AsnC family transcriptional regulator [Candidatus Aenigmarchaeota archaeon]
MRELDQKIIRELEKNSRQTNIQIAKKLKVSEGTIRQRVQKLVKNVIIKKFTIELSTLSGFSAMVLIELDPHKQIKGVIKQIQKIDDVKRIIETAGAYDLIIEISTSSASQFNNIIDKIRAIEGTKKTESMVVLNVV